jgi:hypothetical protein
MITILRCQAEAEVSVRRAVAGEAGRRAFPVRPRGLEPPRTNQSTRPSTRISLRRWVFWRPKPANWQVLWTRAIVKCCGSGNEE